MIMKTLVRVLVSCCLMTGCSGPAGHDGAQGPAGAAGANGTDGTDGVDGAKGSDGLKGDKGDLGPAGPTKAPRLLDCKQSYWRAEVREALNKLILEKGITSATYDPAQPPVAVFDWDNTVIKNDIGDATLFWAIRNDKIKRPVSWTSTNSALNADGVAALDAACNGLASVGAALPTSTSAACADEIVSIYDGGKTKAGKSAWTNPLTTTINQQYAWVSQLLAGYTPEEVRDFARAAFDENNNADIGSKQTVGTMSMNGYVRIYSQIDDLIGALKHNGFDVWVLTASPQHVVEGIVHHVGVDQDHVIGIRSVVAGGKLTTDFQDCGGAAKNSLITFDEGKRCWINKVIWGETDAAKQLAQNVPSKRPVLVAGDSDTDIGMLKDATALKLVINRGKVQTVCNAYQSLEKKDGRWFVQPMFIAPNAQKTEYDCPGAKIPGTTSPIVDETGAAFTKKYADTVFELGPQNTCK
jgi:phosphoglycolate phosphatase-like HAD superfamily hydrolase